MPQYSSASEYSITSQKTKYHEAVMMSIILLGTDCETRICTLRKVKAFTGTKVEADCDALWDPRYKQKHVIVSFNTKEACLGFQ